jgi:hypothetical protein
MSGYVRLFQVISVYIRLRLFIIGRVNLLEDITGYIRLRLVTSC